MKALILSALLGSLLCVAPLSAQETRTERVQFERGTNGVTINGRIEGYEGVNYLLGAKAGQSMVVIMNTDNGANYFNIYAPGKKPGTDQGMFIGSTQGNRYEGELPADGDYLVQVFLMRSAARRNEVANYTVEVGISGSSEFTAASNNSINWPADTDASGNLSCSAGEPSFDRKCPFRVKRNNFGATIWTVKPGSTSDLRVLYFESDAFSTDDTTKLSWNRQSDNWWLGAGDQEFYLIPDAVMYGG